MLKKLCLLFLGVFGWVGVNKAQLVKEFKVTDTKGFEMVNLGFSTYKSTTHLKRIKSMEPLYIHGHLQKTNILPVFSQEIKNNLLEASLVHKNVEADNLGKSITSKLFSGSKDDFDHTWDLGLASNFLYNLDFTLGMGKAEFDLAQLPISKMKVKSASADVLIHYGTRDPNQVQMDTLLVTLNMGSVKLNDINFSNARKMIFEVNYGSLDLNFSEAMPSKCQVIAAVGAGTLNLLLPDESNPVKIRVKTTAMCRTTLPKYLKSIDEHTYITKGYKESDPRLLELIVDVGVGSLTIE
ncbi:hypothetical protein [Algoriphagus machipongonensis]|uniref:hypothetical protein n=1 Tax=Algoriphagus machipongonensis TaxID=388413 RepID=UPI0000F3B35A|nr:hypothetical protein [Algoriphagus machipongonensis]